MRQDDDGQTGPDEGERQGRAGAKDGKSRDGWIGWLQIAGVGLVILIAAGATAWLSTRGGEPDAAPPERPDVPVRVTEPLVADHQVSVALTGTVSVTAFVDLTPQVSGRVQSVSDAVRAGARFDAGEVLFQIDPRDYEVAVTRARSALAEARSGFAQARAEADLAREEWNRLYPDQPITPLAAREPQLEAARSRLLSAEADLAQAQLDLERTSVSLPFSGRVTQSRVEAGTLVSAGQSYGQAYDYEAVEVVAPISPTDLARLDQAQGALVRLALEAGGAGFDGRIARVGARLDERTRFLDLYIDPQPEGRVLQPGLFADVLIEGPVLEDVMVLPASAVAGLDEVRLVEDGVIVSERIDVLDRPRGRIIARTFDIHQGVIVSPLPEGAVGRDAEIVERVEPPRAVSPAATLRGPYDEAYDAASDPSGEAPGDGASAAARAADTRQDSEDAAIEQAPEAREGERG